MKKVVMKKVIVIIDPNPIWKNRTTRISEVLSNVTVNHFPKLNEEANNFISSESPQTNLIIWNGCSDEDVIAGFGKHRSKKFLVLEDNSFEEALKSIAKHII